MIKFILDDGDVYVNPEHIIYLNENQEDDVKWIEMYLTTEQVLEVQEPLEDVLQKIIDQKGK